MRKKISKNRIPKKQMVKKTIVFSASCHSRPRPGIQKFKKDISNILLFNISFIKLERRARLFVNRKKMELERIIDPSSLPLIRMTKKGLLSLIGMTKRGKTLRQAQGSSLALGKMTKKKILFCHSDNECKRGGRIFSVLASQTINTIKKTVKAKQNIDNYILSLCHSRPGSGIQSSRKKTGSPVRFGKLPSIRFRTGTTGKLRMTQIIIQKSINKLKRGKKISKQEIKGLERQLITIPNQFKKKTISSLVTAVVIITVMSLISNLLINPSSLINSRNINIAEAATYNWSQTDYSGGASTTAEASHATNQTNWNYYYSKATDIELGTIGTGTPVAHWALNGTTTDSQGTNHGTASGTVPTADGILGSAYYFDGNNDFISVPDSNDLDITNNFTISTWVKKAENGRYQTILSKGSYTLGVGEDNRVYFEANDGSETQGTLGAVDGKSHVYSLQNYNGKLYVATNEGIYYYDNASWNFTNSPTSKFGAMTVFNGKLYAGNSSSEIYRYDGGATWTRVGQITGGGASGISSMVVFEGELYMGTKWNGHIYRYDGGITWTDVGNPFSDSSNLIVHNGILYLGGGQSMPGDYVHYYNGGTDWVNIGNPGSNTRIVGMSVFFDDFYVGTSNSGKVYRYAGGSTWTDVGQIGNSDAAYSLATYNGKLYAGDNSNGEVYRYNSDENWSMVDDRGNYVYGMIVNNGKLNIGTGWGGTVYTVGDGFGLYSENEINDNWNQITISYNGSIASMYVNGALTATTSKSMSIESNALDFFIGKGIGSFKGSRGGNSGEDNFRGNIDEVKIYNTALSDTEVLGNYDAEKYLSGMYLTSTTTTITETTDTHFGDGTATDVDITGSGTGSSLTLALDSGGVDTSEYSFPAGPTPIFRSVGPSNTSSLASSTASVTNLMTIGATGTTTFATALADRIGVGDALIYDSSGNGSIDATDEILFIHGRGSSQEYYFRKEDGTTGSLVTTSDQDVWVIYRAYTSLFNAEAGTINSSISSISGTFFDTWSNGQDIRVSTGTNEIWNIACYGDAIDTDSFIVNDWITATNTFLRIYTPYLESEVGVSQRHNGVWDDSKYNLKSSLDNMDIMINGSVGHVRIEGLQLESSSIDDSINGGIDTGNGIDIRISYNIIREAPGITSGNRAGIHLYLEREVSNYIYNNIVYGFDSTNSQCITVRTSDGSGITNASVFNNTVVNCTYGLMEYSGGGMVFKNNLSFGNSDDYYGSAFHASSTDNAYSQGLDPASGGLDISAHASTTIFRDPANDDYRLKVGSPVIDQGADLSSDTDLSFINDINNDLRPNGASWDIGADEYGQYSTTGTFVSQIIDTTANSWFNDVSWTESVPASTTLYVKIRTSNDSGMSGATGWDDCNPVWSGTDISNNNCVTDGERYFEYRVEMARETVNIELTPTFSDITIDYSAYSVASSELISSPYDSNDTANIVAGLVWDDKTATGTVSTLYIRTGADSASVLSAGWSEIASSTDSYLTSGCTKSVNTVTCDISTIPAGLKDTTDDRWVEYRVVISGNGTYTPSVGNVNLTYVVNAPPDFDSGFGTNGIDIYQIATSSNPYTSVALSKIIN